MRSQRPPALLHQKRINCIAWFLSRRSCSHVHLTLHRENSKVAPGHHSPVSKCASLQSIPEAAELIVAGHEGGRQPSCLLEPCTSAQAQRWTRPGTSPPQRPGRRRALFQSALSHARGEQCMAERMHSYVSLCGKYARAAVQRLRAHADIRGLHHSSTGSQFSSRQRGMHSSTTSLLSHPGHCG